MSGVTITKGVRELKAGVGASNRRRSWGDRRGRCDRRAWSRAPLAGVRREQGIHGSRRTGLTSHGAWDEHGG